MTPNTRLATSSRFTATSDESRSSQVPLALNSHYLLTSYGAQDYQIEMLIDCAIQVMHQTPIVKQDIVLALNSLSRDTVSVLGMIAPSVGGPDVIVQLQQIEIRPQFFSAEEMSKLWSALQARYRPSVVYKASVVLAGRDART